MRPNCMECCFFRFVGTKDNHKRRLCMLTGEKRPKLGIEGCNFTSGKWSEIDSILRLPKATVYGNSGGPNIAKLGKSFKNIANIKFAIIDLVGKSDNSHNGRQFVRPVVREGPVARNARERTGCLFSF